MRTIGIVIALALAVFGIGIAIQHAPRNDPPSACLVQDAPVTVACLQYGRECKYEDGNTDGKECWWINDGNVWYVDGSEYRNDN